MQVLVDAYFRVLKLLTVLCLAAMVVLVFGNVVLRYAFNSGITVSEELSRFFFIWMTFLGAAIGLREHAHLGVDTLVRRLPAAGKKSLLVIGHLLMLYITFLMLKGSWVQTLINRDVQAPATGLSMGLFYGIGVVFSLTTGGILLVELYRVLTGRLTEHELVMVVDSEEQAEFDDLHKDLGTPVPPAGAAAAPGHKS
ncbi:TRAP transporter small permease [Azospirillum canadense]|uniref:TRAP transporter small permease n=1 Tax=Azospirillum canadense TaxID=403962 RepID=UPI00222792CA|nr:TRAP transporter small permease [Azospirillum canadense]MCW2242324.1 TRAP-type C4-dicarboxylate transport system permease small subunit [Azospirillum canadense]MCW2242579.1 TRAP-type C4-dicarboxylate transport system permease small subunit [Azospirillum canadense]